MLGYAEIATHFRRQIADGELSPGEAMPSYAKAAEEFEVNRTTVIRAYDILKSEGLIVSRPGKGTTVAHQSDVAVTGVARLNRLARTGKPYAPGESSTDHWAGLRSLADPLIANLLGVEPHDEVVIRRRVHRRDGKPSTVALSVIHVRALGDVPEILSNAPLERWWQELYKERTGREVTKSPERRTARLISNNELKALGVELPPEAATAALVVVNVFHDEDGPLEVWEDLYPPGSWQVDEE
ncbi:GntR family transcriptional regulator [Streptomyces sp. SID14515]|uniref:GntR family transcriptional regulator n=1 Tax=Streptomyces sp. SID14515 TaxID=2706074 RepID=UPI0013C80C10|nr:GntR family transcriptional regulator [Streptomyces sp. SID14515]NEB42301.1 GntR family transcriptional regulator [Streptomyces sp. SID14515]